MITNGVPGTRSVHDVGHGERNPKTLSSGEFITTPIFSAVQLRDENSRLHAALTVSAASARLMLHFSKRLSVRTGTLSGGRLKIDIVSSGIGSCRSRITFAPSSFGTSAVSTRTSGMLWT